MRILLVLGWTALFIGGSSHDKRPHMRRSVLMSGRNGNGKDWPYSPVREPTLHATEDDFLQRLSREHEEDDMEFGLPNGNRRPNQDWNQQLPQALSNASPNPVLGWGDNGWNAIGWVLLQSTCGWGDSAPVITSTKWTTVTNGGWGWGGLATQLPYSDAVVIASTISCSPVTSTTCITSGSTTTIVLPSTSTVITSVATSTITYTVTTTPDCTLATKWVAAPTTTVVGDYTIWTTSSCPWSTKTVIGPTSTYSYIVAESSCNGGNGCTSISNTSPSTVTAVGTTTVFVPVSPTSIVYTTGSPTTTLPSVTSTYASGMSAQSTGTVTPTTTLPTTTVSGAMYASATATPTLGNASPCVTPCASAQTTTSTIPVQQMACQLSTVLVGTVSTTSITTTTTVFKGSTVTSTFTPSFSINPTNSVCYTDYNSVTTTTITYWVYSDTYLWKTITYTPVTVTPYTITTIVYDQMPQVTTQTLPNSATSISGVASAYTLAPNPNIAVVSAPTYTAPAVTVSNLSIFFSGSVTATCAVGGGWGTPAPGWISSTPTAGWPSNTPQITPPPGWIQPTPTPTQGWSTPTAL